MVPTTLLAIPLIAFLLRAFHQFFDEETVLGEKEWGDGYSAWSETAIGLGLLIAAFRDLLPAENLVTLLAG